MAALVLLVIKGPVETLPMGVQGAAAAHVEPAPLGGPVALANTVVVVVVFPLAAVRSRLVA